MLNIYGLVWVFSLISDWSRHINHVGAVEKHYTECDVLLQEVKLMFPGAQRMNRGNHEIAALVRACKANNVTDLVIVHETRGQPGMYANLSLFFFVLYDVFRSLYGFAHPFMLKNSQWKCEIMSLDNFATILKIAD